MTARGIAFLDVDHTLTRRSTGWRTAWVAVRIGLMRPAALAGLPLMAAWYRFGPIRSASLPGEFPALRGLSLEQLKRLGEETFRRTIRKDIYPAVPAFVEGFRREGRRVVLATSSFDFIVEPLARELGADEVISSSLEVREGRTTGRVRGEIAFGRRKRDLCLARMRELGAAPESCIFCSDSIHDLPLLEAVGRPVAVNPDSRLRRTARARGWEIVDFGVSNLNW